MIVPHLVYKNMVKRWFPNDGVRRVALKKEVNSDTKVE